MSGDIFPIKQADHERMLAVGLAYAVGRLEGMGEDDLGVAKQALDLYVYPQRIVLPVDPPEGK